jgi:hypothetical protein
VTDGLDQALANAGLDMLRADANLNVYESVVPSPLPDISAHPYVLVHTHIEWPPDDPNGALDGLTGRAVVRWICHCIGENAIAARAVAQRVRTQLLDKRPGIAGMVPGMIRHEQDAPPTPAESLGFPVVDAMHVYRLTVDT